LVQTIEDSGHPFSAAAMPYAEDGETWDADVRQHMEGMAENKPGHKSFAEYKLPFWVKHPLTHPFSGVFVDVKDYAYSCSTGTGDGFGNHLARTPAHIAAIYGDLDMFQECTDAEMVSRNIYGRTPAHSAVEHGMSWLLQWMVENGVDTTSVDAAGYTPEEIIYTSARNHSNEMEFLQAAEKGELTEKKNLLAQEYKLKRWRMDGIAPEAEDILEKSKLKQRYFMFKTGEYQLPYEIPTNEEMAKFTLLPSSVVPAPPEKTKPAIPAALLFPGQGSQYVGMMKDCVELPGVAKMLAAAEKVLGWNVKELCLKGPEDKLSETKYCQPCMFIAGLAGLEVMKDSAKKEVVERPQAVAGLSLGEYTAICAAGVLDFEDALELVKLRAEAMQSATQLTPQSMCSVAGLDRPTLEKLCKEAKSLDKTPDDPQCQIANVLFPAGFTCAGTKTTIDQLCKLALAARALQARVIKAGGAFHTPLMKPAEEQLSKAIDAALPKMKPPRCAIYFNLTGKKVPAGTDPSEFVSLMKQQLTGEVQWDPTIRQMIMDQVKDFYEVGPLKQLKSMLKRIDQDAFKRTENIAV